MNGSTSLRGICVSPDGKFVHLTHILAHYQLPTTQLERGWINTNAMTIIDAQTNKVIGVAMVTGTVKSVVRANPKELASGVSKAVKGLLSAHMTRKPKDEK